jgi:short-subunit dehydrogenase
MSNLLSARHRAAFVTGASTGLGLAFVEMLLAEGVEVWGTARDTRRIPARARLHAVALDLADGPAAEHAFLQADRAAGGFDLVINNAGFGAFGGFAETEFGVWERQMQIMLVNTARLAHAALRGMLARERGALVNVSSLAAEFPLPYQPAYNVVKSGLSALSEGLMIETRGTGVVVIDFRPGDYRTDFEGSVQRPAAITVPAQQRAWAAFSKLMTTAPAPTHAAESLRRALRRGRSGTVRTGRVFQAVIGPFLARFGTQGVRRAILRRYFDL